MKLSGNDELPADQLACFDDVSVPAHDCRIIAQDAPVRVPRDINLLDFEVSARLQVVEYLPEQFFPVGYMANHISLMYIVIHLFRPGRFGIINNERTIRSRPFRVTIKDV